MRRRLATAAILAILLVVLRPGCHDRWDDEREDREALAQVDSAIPVGAAESTVTRFLERNAYAWGLESAPEFSRQVGLDSTQVADLRQRGLKARYVALEKQGRPIPSMLRARVRLEVYVSDSGRVMAVHREIVYQN